MRCDLNVNGLAKLGTAFPRASGDKMGLIVGAIANHRPNDIEFKQILERLIGECDYTPKVSKVNEVCQSVLARGPQSRMEDKWMKELEVDYDRQREAGANFPNFKCGLCKDMGVVTAWDANKFEFHFSCNNCDHPNASSARPKWHPSLSNKFTRTNPF